MLSLIPKPTTRRLLEESNDGHENGMGKDCKSTFRSCTYYSSIGVPVVLVTYGVWSSCLFTSWDRICLYHETTLCLLLGYPPGVAGNFSLNC